MKKQVVYFGLRRKDWDQAYKVVANGTMVSVVDRIARKRNTNPETLMHVMSLLFSKFFLLNADYTDPMDQPDLDAQRIDQLLGAEGAPYIPGLYTKNKFSIYGSWLYEIASSAEGYTGTQVIQLVSQDQGRWLAPLSSRLTGAQRVKAAMLNVRKLNQYLLDEVAA